MLVFVVSGESVLGYWMVYCCNSQGKNFIVQTGSEPIGAHQVGGDYSSSTSAQSTADNLNSGSSFTYTVYTGSNGQPYVAPTGQPISPTDTRANRFEFPDDNAAREAAMDYASSAGYYHIAPDAEGVPPASSTLYYGTGNPTSVLVVVSNEPGVVDVESSNNVAALETALEGGDTDTTDHSDTGTGSQGLGGGASRAAAQSAVDLAQAAVKQANDAYDRAHEAFLNAPLENQDAAYAALAQAEDARDSANAALNSAIVAAEDGNVAAANAAADRAAAFANAAYTFADAAVRAANDLPGRNLPGGPRRGESWDEYFDRLLEFGTEPGGFTFNNEFEGLSGLTSSWWGEEDWYVDWVEGVQEFFCDTVVFGGIDCWVSEICQNDEIPADPDTSGYLMLTNGNVGAWIQAEKSAAEIPVECNSTGGCSSAYECRAGLCYDGDSPATMYMYKLTYYLANPEEEDVMYHTVCTDEAGSNCFWSMDPSSPDASFSAIQPGQSMSFFGSTAFPLYSEENYAKFCLRFSPPIRAMSGEAGFFEASGYEEFSRTCVNVKIMDTDFYTNAPGGGADTVGGSGATGGTSGGGSGGCMFCNF